MAATLAYVEYLNSATTTATPTKLDLGSTVSENLVPATYPVSVGNYSMTKIFKLSFSGSFNTISQIKAYKSDGEYVTGEVISLGTSSTYHTPTGSSYQDSEATNAIPTSLPSTANVTIGGDLGGTITPTESTSDYIFLQSSVTIQSSAQTANTKTLSFTWTET